MASYHSALTVVTSAVEQRLLPCDYDIAGPLQQRTRRYGPQVYGHRDDGPRRSDGSDYKSSTVLLSLTTLCANYHQLGTTPSTAAKTVSDNSNPIPEAMGHRVHRDPSTEPGQGQCQKAAMQTSTELSNDSNFISPRIARHLHEHHKR